jgi:hypothetical protein
MEADSGQCGGMRLVGNLTAQGCFTLRAGAATMPKCVFEWWPSLSVQNEDVKESRAGAQCLVETGVKCSILLPHPHPSHSHTTICQQERVVAAGRRLGIKHSPVSRTECAHIRKRGLFRRTKEVFSTSRSIYYLPGSRSRYSD